LGNLAMSVPSSLSNPLVKQHLHSLRNILANYVSLWFAKFKRPRGLAGHRSALPQHAQLVFSSSCRENRTSSCPVSPR